MPADVAPVDGMARALAKREWLLETIERQRYLAPCLVRPPGIPKWVITEAIAMPASGTVKMLPCSGRR
jgi:hypothetical protein